MIRRAASIFSDAVGHRGSNVAAAAGKARRGRQLADTFTAGNVNTRSR